MSEYRRRGGCGRNDEQKAEIRCHSPLERLPTGGKSRATSGKRRTSWSAESQEVERRISSIR